jgi:hypothetical protein
MFDLDQCTHHLNQVLCALSLTAQTETKPDVEWWMHYQIRQADLSEHYDDMIEVRDSGVRISLVIPNSLPGRGLFTKKAFKTGDHVISFAGYWMEATVWAAEDPETRSYAFSVPEHEDWPDMLNLVYVTHKGQADFINCGMIGDEVC